MADSFTTWSDLYSQLLNDIKGYNGKVAEYSIGERQLKYRNWEELQKILSFVKLMMATTETKTTVGRTYAKLVKTG